MRWMAITKTQIKGQEATEQVYLHMVLTLPLSNRPLSVLSKQRLPYSNHWGTVLSRCQKRFLLLFLLRRLTFEHVFSTHTCTDIHYRTIAVKYVLRNKMIKATGAFWEHWNQQASAQGMAWMTVHAGPSKNLSEVKVSRNPLKCSLPERKRSVDFGAEPTWIRILTLSFIMCPWMVIFISHICEVAEYHPPRRGLRVLHEVAALCSGPDLGICPWGINLMISSKPWEEPLAERPVQERGQLPQHTGLWRYSRCSAAPSSWLRRAWAQSENLSQQFCHLPGRGLQSNPACSGPARWWAPVGTSWLGKQLASHTVTFLNAQVPHKTLWLNTGSWRYMG